ncbi:hypothetical protein COC42_10625 [Sphingomonas spermidinifaciens]|uniref:DUF3035 domain-containing protein n=1 Tax=Sphingomonas spermidinifaciens TaxID=1141889 RepID=A0A2A4B2E0_9SPHN|nr:DUF3035 domain-containing protein [Sphingomonas spermidinifaciens]PCD01949.1 hypothetical protein COC42_10625 [Sphingomonas spermidinifaciens]
MRKMFALGLVALSLAGCGKSGLDRDRPDEFATARQAPLVIPPDFALVPPQPGAPRPQDVSPSVQAADALFGGPAPRSAGESAAIRAAGGSSADPGVRSAVGDPSTNVIDKGTTVRDVVAAPQGDGQDARAVAGTPAPATTPPQN